MGLRPLLKLGKLRGCLKSLFSVAKRLDPPKSPDKLGDFDSGFPPFKGGLGGINKCKDTANNFSNNLLRNSVLFTQKVYLLLV